MKTTDKELQKEINEIISAAGTPEEALEKICNTYPEVDREVLIKNFEEEKEKAKNWPYVVGIAAVATVGAVYWIRGYRSKANPQTLAAAEKKGYNDGVNETLTTKEMQHADIGLNANDFVNK